MAPSRSDDENHFTTVACLLALASTEIQQSYDTVALTLESQPDRLAKLFHVLHVLVRRSAQKSSRGARHLKKRYKWTKKKKKSALSKTKEGSRKTSEDVVGHSPKHSGHKRHNAPSDPGNWNGVLSRSSTLGGFQTRNES